jgi:hypothetical protein
LSREFRESHFFLPSHVLALTADLYATRTQVRQGVMDGIERSDNGRRQDSKLGDVDLQACEALAGIGAASVRCA